MAAPTKEFDAAKVKLLSPYQLREVFREANDLYSEKDFAGAAQRYTALITAGMHYPEIYYNAGIAYAKASEPGLAVWSFEKAARLAPRDADIRASLLRLSPPENHPASFVLFWPFIAFAGFFTLQESLLIAAGAWWIGLLGFALAALGRHPRLRSWMRTLGRLGTIALIIFAVIAGAKAYSQYGKDWAIVTASGVVIGHSAPSLEAGKDFDLPAGLRVLRAANLAGGWTEIKLPNGSRTFVPANDLRPL
ncbi:MAG: hypothetical protein NTX50_10470 [Candidatus Sumerlaeota bacterium]|nr:hypothetical protein [Candidatus Sumerlaeota bacterium]